DHPANDNAASRTKTTLSIFDSPKNALPSPGVRAREVEFKTYLVDASGPRWETSWRLITTRDAQGNLGERVMDVKGAPAKTFAKELNTANWNIGRRTEPLDDGTKNVRPTGKTEQVANPFFKR
ncbi:MAG TPA: hypothetical protein VHY20_14700, partial [Pirellulales bacterium]|nr:hypothetical protein [Pirellulales bacterium]